MDRNLKGLTRMLLALGAIALSGSSQGHTNKKRITSPALMHVAMIVCDVDRTLRFYGDAFGLRKKYEFSGTKTLDGKPVYNGRGVYLDLGGSTYLELFPGGGCGRTPGAEATLVQHFALRVPDLEAAYRKALAAGGHPYGFRQPPWDGTPSSVVLNGRPSFSVRVAFVAGPDGELIELYQQTSPVPVR